jgi:acyl-coenzyme A thioesterase PaaI-like protein
LPLAHHDLCFGCGLANVFGLHVELEPRESGGVEGRFFVKQDHQGPPGLGHGGILAAALDEAMALAIHAEGTLAYTTRLEVELRAPARIGTFVRLEAWIERRDDGPIEARARAYAAGDGALVAEARGVFLRPDRSGRA